MKIYIIMILEDAEANKFIYKGISTIGCDWQNITNMLHISRKKKKKKKKKPIHCFSDVCIYIYIYIFFFSFFFHVIYKNYLFTINTLKLTCHNSSLMDSICTREPFKKFREAITIIFSFFLFLFWLVDSGGGGGVRTTSMRYTKNAITVGLSLEPHDIPFFYSKKP